MNNLQRGIYQPRADMVPIYYLADEERSRTPLLVVIALAWLAASAGVVWLAYSQGLERGRQGASLVFTAPEEPVRVAPPEAVPAPRLNRYNEPVSTEQKAKTSVLAPQTAAKAEPQPIRRSQAASPPARAAQGTRAAQPAATSGALSGSAVLQLGAFDSQELANASWAGFRARYAMAATWAADVQRTDLGQKGIMYRLRVGPFADRQAATNACGQLKAAGANCLVVLQR